MQYALDTNNERVTPTATGQRAKCPGCEDEVLSSCGRIMIWHWRHRSSNCDPWYEPESEWHRKWKEHFDQECREVIIRQNEIWHRADIRTHAGTVIEFQNSSIDPDSIVAREKFYDKMLWVVNARQFSLYLTSIHKSSVSEIERESKKALDNIKEDYERELQVIRDKIYLAKDKISNYKSRLEPILEEIHEMETGMNGISYYVERLSGYWLNHQWFYPLREYQKVLDVQDFFVRSVKKYREMYNELHPERDKKQKQLDYICGLEDYKIEGRVFKVIPYLKIPNRAYSKARAIPLDQSEASDFRIISFANEYELRDIKVRQQYFTFLIDADDTIQKLMSEINELNSLLRPAEEVISEAKGHVKNMILSAFQKMLPSRNRDADLITVQIEQIQLRILAYDKELSDHLKRKDEYFVDQKQQIESRLAVALDDLRQTDETLFKYRWGRERKSWRFAEKKLYFDIGDKYLYERIDSEILKRVKKTSFVDSHNPLI